MEAAPRLRARVDDVSSSWGSLPDFIICDELCHWERPDLWYSLFSSAAKRPDCVLTVLTNAGIGRGWHWNVREAARSSPAWHFSSLEGPQAPWISPAQLDEQRRLLPPPVYARLWENRWQHSDGEFVTLAEAEACRDPSLRYQTHGEPGRTYVAAIDYAEKHDLTVGVVLHVEGDSKSQAPNPRQIPSSKARNPASAGVSDIGASNLGSVCDLGFAVCDFASRARILVDRMDVVAPRPGRPTPIAWVEDWMHEIARNFQHVTFIVDEYQLLGTIQRLETIYDVRRFDFRAGRGNHALALNLRKLIANREIAWYPNCGSVGCVTSRQDDINHPPDSAAACGSQQPETPTHHSNSPTPANPRDDLETELASLLLLFHQAPSGLCSGSVGCVTSRQDDINHPPDSAAACGSQQPETPTHHSSSPIPPHPRDDLETELASLLFRQAPSGLCRIDHRRDGRHHDDRSFALGAACLHIAQQPAADDWLMITPPDKGEFEW